MIDLKDLFQVIFNMRKKEAEASQKASQGGDFKETWAVEMLVQERKHFLLPPESQ